NACDGAGNCKLITGQGPCTSDPQCVSGHCVDGVCCGATSCGTCQTGNGGAPGSCTNILMNQPDNFPAEACVAVCSSGSLQLQACDGSGACVMGALNACSP